MPWIEFVLALALAVAFTSLLIWGLGWRHPAQTDAVTASALFLFIIMFLAVWAAGMWLPPWGPLIRGVPWLGFFIVGLLLSLLILALASPSPRPPAPAEQPVEEEVEKERLALHVFGIFFWILIVALVAVGLISYANA